jgi:hypothetical protein
MVAIRAKTLMDRVNLFIKIADKDGNKALSYDEVHNLTKMCLTKYIKVIIHNIIGRLSTIG